jgi:hypothetical protein
LYRGDDGKGDGRVSARSGFPTISDSVPSEQLRELRARTMQDILLP